MQQQRHGALKVQAKSPRAHLDILDVSLSIYHAANKNAMETESGTERGTLN